MLRRRYSKDLDVLIALISNLAIGEYSQKSPNSLAKETSISETEITRVLSEYKSLFREASKPKNEGVQKPYSLHLRHALQYEQNEDNERRKPPIETEYVTSLISFVTQKANDEENWNLQSLLTIFTALASLVVALIALFGKGC